MQKRESVLRNIRLIYLFNFLGGLMFFLPIYALYLQQELFTVFNVTLIIAIGSIATLIFEVPSGAIADLFGRKKTIILSSVLQVIALIFLVIGTNLILFIIFAIINSLARSLLSGTDTAILFDTLKEKDKEIKKEARALSEAEIERKEVRLIPENIKKPSFKKVIAINNAMWPMGASISSVLGGLLATISLRLPIVITIIPFSLAIILAFFLKEPKYTKEKHKNIFLHMFKSAKIILKKKQIFLLVLAGFLFYAFGEVSHQLKPIFFEFKNISVEFYGLIFTGIFVLSFVGSLISGRISKKIGNKRTILLTAIVSPLLLFISTLLFGLWIAIPLIAASLFFGMRWPIIIHLLNLEVKSKNRATVISAGNFFNHLGLALFAPFFGCIIDLWNVNNAFKLAAGLFLIVLIPLSFIKEKD